MKIQHQIHQLISCGRNQKIKVSSCCKEQKQKQFRPISWSLQDQRSDLEIWDFEQAVDMKTQKIFSAKNYLLWILKKTEFSEELQFKKGTSKPGFMQPEVLWFRWLGEKSVLFYLCLSPFYGGQMSVIRISFIFLSDLERFKNRFSVTGSSTSALVWLNLVLTRMNVTISSMQHPFV